MIRRAALLRRSLVYATVTALLLGAYVGLLLLVLYVPLYMWRMAEDKRMGGTSYAREGVASEKLAE